MFGKKYRSTGELNLFLRSSSVAPVKNLAFSFYSSRHQIAVAKSARVHRSLAPKLKKSCVWSLVEEGTSKQCTHGNRLTSQLLRFIISANSPTRCLRGSSNIIVSFRHSTRIPFPTQSQSHCIRRYSSSQANSAQVSESASKSPSSTSKTKRKKRPLTAAEKQWIEDGETLLEEKNDNNRAKNIQIEVSQRFDWRLRAKQRFSKFKVADESDEPKKRVRLATEKALAHSDEFFDEIHNYRSRFLPLLDAEEKIELEEIRRRLEILSLEKLQEEGFCLTGLSAFWLSDTHFGRPVASFMKGPGVALPSHMFRNGNKILLSRLDPRKDKPYHGSVLSLGFSNLKICFDEEFDISDGIWRMDFDSSSIAYERMRLAMDYLFLDPTAQASSNSNKKNVEVVLQGTYLRDILLHSFSPSYENTNNVTVEQESHSSSNIKKDGHTHLQDPSDSQYLPLDILEYPNRPSKATARINKDTSSTGSAFCGDMRITSWAKRYKEKYPLKIIGDPELTGLNASQTRAIALMIGERLSLVQGPPGTGKTKTIVEAVKLLKLHFEVVHPILVCTYTNVAVDNLVEGFIRAGLNPLRIGLDTKIRSNLYEYTLERKLALHPLRDKYDKILFRLKEVYEGIQDTRKMIQNTEGLPSFPTTELELRIGKMKDHLNKLTAEKKQLRGREVRLQSKMVRDIVDQADVVCTTCLTAGSFYLNVTDFPVVFLDEASMSTEPASLIPIMKGCQHLALIGDHKQLPPIIQSREAQRGGLDISLFERLTKEGNVPSIMLDTQYRMHPGISRFPSSEFYNYALIDGTIDASGHISADLLPPVSSHLLVDPKTGHRPSVIFLDHQGLESTLKRSRVNWTEAYIVCSIVEDLLLNNDLLEGEQIGIIAPYVSQINLLNRLLLRDEKLRERYISILGEERAMDMANIDIKTVDGFEGREKEVIIFSTVRNNPNGYIGFLADRRRLNVGLTRAKRALFVVGSMSTLSKGKYGKYSTEADELVGVKGAKAWKNFTQYLSQENLVLPLRGHSLRSVLDLRPRPHVFT